VCGRLGICLLAVREWRPVPTAETRVGTGRRVGACGSVAFLLAESDELSVGHGCSGPELRLHREVQGLRRADAHLVHDDISQRLQGFFPPLLPARSRSEEPAPLRLTRVFIIYVSQGWHGAILQKNPPQPRQAVSWQDRTDTIAKKERIVNASTLTHVYKKRDRTHKSPIPVRL
jgi:hypothetical protein